MEVKYKTYGPSGENRINTTVHIQWANKNICQYLGFKPNVNIEPDNVNEGKGVGYLTEKWEVCSLSPAALHLTASSWSITPSD